MHILYNIYFCQTYDELDERLARSIVHRHRTPSTSRSNSPSLHCCRHHHQSPYYQHHQRRDTPKSLVHHRDLASSSDCYNSASASTDVSKKKPLRAIECTSHKREETDSSSVEDDFTGLDDTPTRDCGMLNTSSGSSEVNN